MLAKALQWEAGTRSYNVLINHFFREFKLKICVREEGLQILIIRFTLLGEKVEHLSFLDWNDPVYLAVVFR